MSIADIASRLATHLDALAARLRTVAPTRRTERVTYGDLRVGDEIVRLPWVAADVATVEAIECPEGRRPMGRVAPYCNLTLRCPDGHAGYVAGPLLSSPVERVVR